MAKLDISALDGLIDMLEKAEAPEKIAKKAIAKAEGKLLTATKNAIKAALTDKTASGLVNSIVPTGAKQNQWGVYTVVRPVGSDPQGIEYSQKALWLEYGRWHKGNAGRNGTYEENNIQKPHPWRQKAINDSEAAVTRIIEEVLEAEILK